MQGIRNESATQRGSRSLQEMSIDRAVFFATVVGLAIMPSKSVSCSADPARSSTVLTSVHALQLDLVGSSESAHYPSGLASIVQPTPNKSSSIGGQVWQCIMLCSLSRSAAAAG